MSLLSSKSYVWSLSIDHFFFSLEKGSTRKECSKKSKYSKNMSISHFTGCLFYFPQVNTKEKFRQKLQDFKAERCWCYWLFPKGLFSKLFEGYLCFFLMELPQFLYVNWFFAIFTIKSYEGKMAKKWIVMRYFIYIFYY